MARAIEPPAGNFGVSRLPQLTGLYIANVVMSQYDIASMPLDQTKELVDELRGFYQKGSTRQKDLAGQLGLTPQGLNEILAGRNRPTASQVLGIQAFLRNQNTMNQTVEPKTLLEAKGQIESLTSELKSLRAGSTPGAVAPASIAPLKRPAPKLAGGSYAPSKDAPKMKSSTPAVVRKTWPKTGLDSPFAILEFLKTAPFGDCLDLLADTNATKLQRGICYQTVKERRALGDG